MINLTPKTVFAIGGVVLVFAYLAKRQVVEASQALAEAVNPVSSENVFYSGASKITKALTGNQNKTFGTWLYDVTHPGE